DRPGDRPSLRAVAVTGNRRDGRQRQESPSVRSGADSFVAAAAAVGGPEDRRYRGGRSPRPPPVRPGRRFLAVPTLPVGRPRPLNRLAPLGAERPGLRARERMGGSADGLALARRISFDAVRVASRSP